MMKLIFYQNMVCPHEADFIRALAARSDMRITWVVDEEVLPFRRKMGISRPDCGAATVIVTTDETRIRQIVLDADPQAIHIVQGPRNGVCSRVAWRQSLAAGRKVGIYSEAGDHRGLKGVLRRLLYAYEYHQWGRRMRFVLAMGQLGTDWFARSGYPSSLVFPFCYVTQPAGGGVAASQPAREFFHIVYCGQLIKRKNIDILLKALAQLKGREWVCSIIGDGPLRGPLRHLSETLGIAGRIKWLGVLPNAEVQGVLSVCDTLVLPSAFDGWGAVVNEALSAGTPVICSAACGAADLLRERWRGCSVRTGSPTELAVAIAERMDGGRLTPAQRERIRAWSVDHIAGGPVADYFVKLMEHVYRAGPRPMAPWRRPAHDVSRTIAA